MTPSSSDHPMPLAIGSKEFADQAVTVASDTVYYTTNMCEARFSCFNSFGNPLWHKRRAGATVSDSRYERGVQWLNINSFSYILDGVVLAMQTLPYTACPSSLQALHPSFSRYKTPSLRRIARITRQSTIKMASTQSGGILPLLLQTNLVHHSSPPDSVSWDPSFTL
jgi:hypothetical protein